MATILEEILKPTQEIDGVRYFDGESALLLSAAVSDLGRDYMIQDVPDGHGGTEPVKLSIAIEAIYSGRWVPGPELEERLGRIRKDFTQLPLKAVEEFGRFSYSDPRDQQDEERTFDPLGKYADLPEKYLGRLGAAHHGTIRKLCKKMLATDGFLGEIKGRLNGLDLRYFDSQSISPQGNSYYDAGFYLHYFFDGEGHLVAWKTGIPSNFKRDGLYTVIGGSVKAHDRYPGQPPKTLISRAKFFDHQTGDKYLEREEQ